METIFGLFSTYDDAEATTRMLLDKGFSEDEMNAIVLEDVAKNEMDVNLDKITVEVTDEIGQRTARGLYAMLASRQPVRLTGVGRVYAAGELASVLVTTASVPGAADGGFQAALEDFGVPEDEAQAYVNGMLDGGILFFIRTSDERAAEAREALLGHKARQVATNIG